MSRWILPGPDELDVWKDEERETGADPIPQEWIRITKVPAEFIYDNSSEPSDPSHDPTVRRIRRQMRAGVPIPPATLTIRRPLNDAGDSPHAHIDGAHRSHAARLEGIKMIPMAVVFVDRSTDEPMPPPLDWNAITADFVDRSFQRRENFFHRIHEDNERHAAEMRARDLET